MNYKETINLLDTPFPMRGDLARREPEMLRQFQEKQLYQALRHKFQNRPKFILHDGPPYANGTLHIGHAQNKILKDIIIRYKTLMGFDAPFVPGWDCHGLPIELNIEKKFGKHLSSADFRTKCRAYAEQEIQGQRDDFMRLGILGDWDKPYKTMNFITEANIVRALGEVYKNGYLAQGVKPVHWCIECGSALAEAEVEYQEKTSHAIYVKFALSDELNPNIIKKIVSCKPTTNTTMPLITALLFNITSDNQCSLNPQFQNTSAVIWTTTPWTLPANKALCLGADIQYSLIEYNQEYLIVASDLIQHFMQQINPTGTVTPYKVLATQMGMQLEGLKFHHPFYTKTVPMILGEHVTTDVGTGIVHTAPAHGIEDYQVSMLYNIEIDNPVDDNGCFLSTTQYFAHKTVWEANSLVIDVLQQRGKLLFQSILKHSYPHCWRHKTPLIFRTTAQWFIHMDGISPITHKSLRELAANAMEQVKFYPTWGKVRLESMINKRPDWCISRQRHWGSPMTFLMHKHTGELHPNSYNILMQVAQKIEQQGIEAWFSMQVSDILPADEATHYTKLPDTLDVWFDSGTTHYSILQNTPTLQYPADLYLEGSDQHRGWFQSSLITSCAITGIAPYKQLLTHCFVVDGKGYKMSKSKGNIVSIKQIVNKYGADILRLWVASTDYSDDVSFSDEIMQRTSDNYRRLRNTLRFLLANIVDFNFATDAIHTDNLVEIDKYALIMLADLHSKVVDELYPNYQFHLLIQELVVFCSENLGGFYLDILKDRLYTSKNNSIARRSAQTVLYHLANSLTLMLSPILFFTADEVWAEIHHNPDDSTLFHQFYNVPVINNALVITQRWQTISEFRVIVLKELENYRSAGSIGSSLQAELIINAPLPLFNVLSSLQQDLKFAYMVSHIVLNLSDTTQVQVIISDKLKCERCWHYSATIGTNAQHSSICSRCIDNINGAGEVRTYA